MKQPGPLAERAPGHRVRRNLPSLRSPLFILTGALMTTGCGGAGMAPVVERSTVASGSSQAAGVSGGTAAGEASDGDWTATVRPLGDSGSTAGRQLASEQTLAGAAPASSSGGAAAPAARTAPPPAPGQPSAVASGTVSPAAAPRAVANPAVVSLLNTASAQSRAGDHGRAAATLERAIAIEPDNAWLWYRLADTRLAQGRLDQAASLAAKSNSFAATDRGLQADNWRLIAEVRRRQGNSGAAAAAESQATRLSN